MGAAVDVCNITMWPCARDCGKVARPADFSRSCELLRHVANFDGDYEQLLNLTVW